MLTEICAELRNWFVVQGGKHIGTYTVSGGSIMPLDFLQDGQYFRIIGSVFNDGVHKYPASNLTDEVFDGAVWAMAIPATVLSLASEIDDYCKSDTAKITGFASESFGGYSYSKFTDGNGGDGSLWQNAFKMKLKQWRKM